MYFVIFVDDATHKVWVYFLKARSKLVEVFKKWRAFVEESGCKVRCLRSEIGGYQCSVDLHRFCMETSILWLDGSPDTAQEIGVASMMIRNIEGRAERSRLQSGLPEEFWAEAVDTAVYLVNHGLAMILDLNLGVPDEAWTGCVSLQHLRVFGCTCYPGMDSADGSKTVHGSKKCSFIGYVTEEFGYKVYDHEERKTYTFRDVVFDEDELYGEWSRQVEQEQSVCVELDVQPVPVSLHVQKRRKTLPVQRYFPSLFLLMDGGRSHSHDDDEVERVDPMCTWEFTM